MPQVIYAGGFKTKATFIYVFNQDDIMAVIFVTGKAANCSI